MSSRYYKRPRVAYENWSTGDYPKGKTRDVSSHATVSVPTAGYGFANNKVKAPGVYGTARLKARKRKAKSPWKVRKISP